MSVDPRRLYPLIATHLPETIRFMGKLAQRLETPDALSVFWPSNLPLPSIPHTPRIIETPSLAQPEAVLPLIEEVATPFTIVLIDPTAPLLEQLDGLAGLLHELGREPDRIITIADCHAAANEPRMREFLEAALFHSDLVLLGNRLDSEKAFVRKFQKDYEQRRLPSEFMMLKKEGTPQDWQACLASHTRRLSHLFDLEDPATAPEDTPGLQIEASFDLDMAEGAEDPYFPLDPEQLPRTVPDISDLVILAE
jgi:hypothetical protein